MTLSFLTILPVLSDTTNGKIWVLLYNIDINQNEVQDCLKNTLVHALRSLYGKTSKKYRKKYQPNLLLHSYGIHTSCRESSRVTDL